MRYLNTLLNNVTMYRLVLYGLTGTATIAILFGFTGVLQFSGLGLLLSLAIFVTVCLAMNILLARLTNAASSLESSLITGLILFFIFAPPTTFNTALLLALVGVIAIASKYFIAINKRHILNPAAAAALIVGTLGLTTARWWVATDAMVIFVVLLGIMVLQKLHRWQLFMSFFAAASLAMVITSLRDGYSLGSLPSDIIISAPFIFLGTIMLTEPLTLPPTKKYLAVYGVLVGVLLGSRVHIGSLYMTPELALIIGNIFAYSTGLKRRLSFRYVGKQKIAINTYSFIFQPQPVFDYVPGQYLEVTLPHQKADSRGNRRVFSIASSPTEKEISFGLKMSQRSSSFKRALSDLEQGKYLVASRLAGDFTLPKDAAEKLVFIAGGIGITPFRSMVKYLIDTKQKRDIVLFYQVQTYEHAAYSNVLAQASQYGIKVVYVFNQPSNTKVIHEVGYITPKMLRQHIPDYAGRRFYISGPSAMVDSYNALLRANGVKSTRIVTDYFSGY